MPSAPRPGCRSGHNGGMAFKKRVAEGPQPSDPEELYRMLPGSGDAPPALWLHQGDVLRSWHREYGDSGDVALELPTGAGKTLVGGLIGEFRRRTTHARVVYLCPTRQLAQQSHEELVSYGIPAALLTGKVATWNYAERARYSSAQAIAVSVYSHVFNSNPALNDAQFMILDDAHAAESSVASPWSITITREYSAYQDTLSVLADAFDPLVVNRLRADHPAGPYLASVYLASPAGVAAAAVTLESALEAASQSGGLPPDATFALKLMAGHLGRCLVYASYRQLQIRPLIAPTAIHPAFDTPAQRLYMSATLGAGGELERNFGRRHIGRIPAPKGWDRQGTGRRFVCFPELTTDLSADPEQANAWIADTITAAGRTVVLTPDKRRAEDFAAHRLPPDIAIYHASDVEDDLSVFTSCTEAALLLTNRYDGIDLPDNDCRLVVLDGLPARGDLQERFLHSALGALEVLQERIRARIVQGAGRATRNSGDYAAVLVLGNDLTSFCTRNDVLDAMHPEVHAEMVFGLTNSLDTPSSEMRENLRAFFDHSQEWREVEGDITADRDRLDRLDPPGAPELAAAASHEVAAWSAAWQGEWDKALDHARNVIDALRGGRASQRYAALWNYLASCWSVQLFEQTGDPGLPAASAAYYRAARAAGRGTTWLSHLASPSDKIIDEAAPVDVDPLDVAAATNIAAALPRLGRAARFDRQATTARTSLLATDSGPYEEGLVYLGLLAGAQPSDGDGGATGAPDATWIFSNELWVCWEAKSEADPAGELGATDARQAGGHLRYVAYERREPIPSASVSLLMMPQRRVHPTARAVAEPHVFVVRSTTVIDLFDRLIRAWRTVRAQGGDRVPVDSVIAALGAEGALPTQWLPRVTSVPLSTAGGSGSDTI